MMKKETSLPFGAQILGDGKVRFRVWAPKVSRVELFLKRMGKAREGEKKIAMAAEGGGFFSTTQEALAGDRYGYCLGDSKKILPDPASRFQPDGVDGLSEIIDPSAFRWTDENWPGLELSGQVVYEMHIGAFTREGTWRAAMRELDELARLGVTALEVMPVAEFFGEFGWGYDGVDFFAPTKNYGTPDDFRAFVDRAHALGLGVLLDVVYNHFGPDGNYIHEFSDSFFPSKYDNEWGAAPNFDGENCAIVREFFLANAEYWIREFHLDGYRFDALHTIHDGSKKHIAVEMAERARTAAGTRKILLLGEFQPPRPKPESTMIQYPLRSGYDAVWNEDFHHSAKVALTARTEGYLSDHLGAPQEFISLAKYGCLYQGQYAAWIGRRRGSPMRGMRPASLVNFLENHDQVANTGLGERVHRRASPGKLRALTALLLLGPQTPMIFFGQEFASSSPFFYFADRPHAAKDLAEGRAKFLAQFPSLALPETRAQFPLPTDRATFERCRLDFSEREKNAAIYKLHRDLLALRRNDPVFKKQAMEGMDGAVLGAAAFALRFFSNEGAERLLLVNLGVDLDLRVAPEPLLAPPVGKKWKLIWSSEDPGYGGAGTPEPESRECWHLQGECACVLAPVDEEAASAEL